MSMSNPNNNTIKPTKKFFQWAGGDGNIKCYDSETKTNSFLELPFKFIKLDTLSTVAGWSDADDSNYFSNEVRSIKSEPFIIKTKNGVKKEGLWEDLREAFKAQGGKFASSVYIAYLNEEGDVELGNFKFFGSSITEWINFTKENKIKDGDAVVIDGSNQAKKGKTVYYTPTFSTLEVTNEQKTEANKLDQELQTYLNSYFDYGNKYKEEKAQSVSATSGQSISVDNEDIPEDLDIPF